jgi:hypothetical protein
MKKSAKVLCKLSSAAFWNKPNRHINRKCMVPDSLKKRGGLSTHNSSAEEVGLEAFLYLAAQNFELL